MPGEQRGCADGQDDRPHHCDPPPELERTQEGRVDERVGLAPGVRVLQGRHPTTRCPPRPPSADRGVGDPPLADRCAGRGVVEFGVLIPCSFPPRRAHAFTRPRCSRPAVEAIAVESAAGQARSHHPPRVMPGSRPAPSVADRVVRAADTVTQTTRSPATPDDTPLLDTLAAMTAASTEECDLEPRKLMLADRRPRRDGRAAAVPPGQRRHRQLRRGHPRRRPGCSGRRRRHRRHRPGHVGGRQHCPRPRLRDRRATPSGRPRVVPPGWRRSAWPSRRATVVAGIPVAVDSSCAARAATAVPITGYP